MKLHPDSVEQMTWDNLLINGWFKDALLGNLVQMFKSQYGSEPIASLRRSPVHLGHYSGGVRRFVAAYLPKISERLWNGESKADILFYLMSCKTDILVHAIDEAKHKEEVSAIKKSKNLLIKASKAKKELNEKYESHRASNQWGITK